MSTQTVPVITLDGPSGVGKGTICLRVAEKLGWHILDSGSLYRLTALMASRHASFNTIPQLVDIATNLDVEYAPVDGQLKISLQGEDVTDEVREESVGLMASKIAAIPEVRQALLARQKAFAISPGLVADGRDMGSTVFPDAELKIFLTAESEERAKRRYKQLKEKGIGANLPRLIAELKQRDERDSTRSASPLVAAQDAVTIDTTHLDIEQVYDEVMQRVKQSTSIDV